MFVYVIHSIINNTKNTTKLKLDDMGNNILNMIAENHLKNTNKRGLSFVSKWLHRAMNNIRERKISGTDGMFNYKGSTDK